ncbi:MAG: DUF2080 family transposase-associated protein [Nitrosopumilaceae archaeon]
MNGNTATVGKLLPKDWRGKRLV